MDLVERDGFLHVGSLRLADLVDRVGTPFVLYDADAIIERFYRFVEAFASLRAMICFGVDACPNAHIMRRLVKRGAALRVRSATDLERAWICGAPISRVIYSGLGKTDMDIRAALDGLYSPLFQAGRLVDGKPPYYRGPVGYFSIESGAELEQIARIAGGVRIACRALIHVCLDCCQQSPLGVSPAEAIDLFERFGNEPRVRLAGLRIHLGALGFSPDAMRAGAQRLCEIAQALLDRGVSLEALDIGGGFGCDLFDPAAPSPETYARAVEPVLSPWVERGLKIIAEPGWSIIGAGSLLVTRVLSSRACEHGRLAAAEAVPGEPTAALAPARLLTPTPPRPGGISTVAGVDHSSRCVQVPITCQPSDLLAFPGGGAYARRDNPACAEILLEQSRVFVIRPRTTPLEAIEPELESHEVLL
ncbi:MAG: hypothetical protein KJZ65_07615 [Phycisphaerales bacterium]|nr:hypothetical protein [Phycisphaerales bacterium]